MLVFVCLLLPIHSAATQQTPDTVRYNGSVLSWQGHALDPLLKARGIKLAIRRTDAYDGYIASWEIKGDKIFLRGLLAWIKTEGFDGESKIKEVGLEFLFPDSRAVFADWFSGKMILLESESKFNEDWLVEATYWYLSVESGVVTKSTRVKETFDFHYDEQASRYFKLFCKSPRR